MNMQAHTQDKYGGQRPILVTGATGKQGGAAARHLLRQGLSVRALTRNPQSKAAQALAKQGAEVVRGDFADQSSLEAALQDVYGVFSVQDFFAAGYEGEIRQGKLLADRAKAAGVQHIVYTSVGSANQETGISHFESKAEIERHIRASGISYTILRPVAFMDNWEYSREQILSGTLALPLYPDKPFQGIATDDIGAFVALAFAHPSEWAGRELDIAGDEVTMAQFVDLLSRMVGRPVRYEQISIEQFRQAMGDEYATMYQWFNDAGYQADIPRLRTIYPRLTTLEQYLRTHSWVDAATSTAR